MDERVSRSASQPDGAVPLRGGAATSFIASRPPRLWLAGGIALLVAVAAGAVWLLGPRNNAVQYTTAAVTRGAVTRTVTATGTVNPELTIIVGTYVSGVIQQLFCDYNTQVKKGQVCAQIDPRPYQTIVDQSRANLAVAKAQLEKDKAQLTYAKLAFDRAARLIASDSVSRDAFDAAKSDYEQAKAQITFDEATVQQREAALSAAQVNLDYTAIASPVDGTVVSRNVSTGQTVAASFQTPTLFLIASDLTKMQVDTNVSESDIGSVQLGDKARFTVDAFERRVFEGTVKQVRQSPQTVQNVITYDVVVGVDNAQLALMPGMTAAVRIVVDERQDVLRVPTPALRYVPSGEPRAEDSGPAQIWVLRNGRPAAVPVAPGVEGDSFTEIVGGELAPGDRVIVAERAASASAATTPRMPL